MVDAIALAVPDVVLFREQIIDELADGEVWRCDFPLCVLHKLLDEVRDKAVVLGLFFVLLAQQKSLEFFQCHCFGVVLGVWHCASETVEEKCRNVDKMLIKLCEVVETDFVSFPHIGNLEVTIKFCR